MAITIKAVHTQVAALAFNFAPQCAQLQVSELIPLHQAPNEMGRWPQCGQFFIVISVLLIY
jgi:hypothetical protein